MNDYNKAIEEYSSLYYWDNTVITKTEWGNKESAISYLDKYWLSRSEYKNDWAEIHNEIFKSNSGLPEMVFYDGYDIIANSCGQLLTKEDFLVYQKIMKSNNNKHFVIIEHQMDETIPQLRMKFPVDITWDEINSKNFISSILLNWNQKIYYMYGDSANWGRYVDNEYDHPLEIVGYRNKHKDSIYGKKLLEAKEWKEEVYKHLPKIYRDTIGY